MICPPHVIDKSLENCVFCTKSNKSILYEDDEFLAFLNSNPSAKLHFLVVPKLHYGSVLELNKEHVGMIKRMRDIASDIQRNHSFRPEDCELGFHVPPFTSIHHLHLHGIGKPFKNIFRNLKYPRIETPWWTRCYLNSPEIREIQKMMDDRQAVRVVVRCRPFSNKEKEGGYTCIAKTDLSNATISITDQRPESIGDPPKVFTFDSVFDENVPQINIYNTTARHIVDSVLQGYNGTIFAYGQTGTGKTFTMEGIRDVPELRGIIPNAFEHVFNHIKSCGTSKQFLVRASYLELYNEDVIDLLNPKGGKLDIKERVDVGVYVKDLRSFVIKDIDEMERLMTFGNKNRSVGATEMNVRSSRSHSIFTITVEVSEKDSLGEDHIRVGKLHLVDLAGSERQSKTGATGDRLKEATKINLSLSALGNVISTLVDGKSSHIPYRDSKLTRLLQDSLGGNSNTLMLATLSPASYNFDETLSTLRYANRAKNIKNKPKINEDPKDAMLREFQEEIKRLRDQLENQTTDQVIVKEVEEIHEIEEIEEVETNQECEEQVDQEAENQNECGSKVAKRKKSLLDSKIVAELHEKLEKEKQEILADKDIQESEKLKLIEEATKRMQELENEKAKKEELSRKLQHLEQKLLVGGVNLLDKNQEQKLMLAKKAQELEDIARKERELQRELIDQEETGIQIEEEFTSLQEEANAKTKKLKKLWNSYQIQKSELSDLKEEYVRSREDLFDTIRDLQKDLSYRQLLIDNFIGPEEQLLLHELAEFDNSSEKWIIASMNFGGNNLKKVAQSPRSKKAQVPTNTNPYLHYNDQNLKVSLKKKSANKKTAGSSLKKELVDSEKSIPEARGLVGKSKRYA